MSQFIGGSGAALADLLVAPGEEVSAVTPLVEHAASSQHDFASLFGLSGSSRLVAALPPGSLRLIERLEAPVLDLTPGWDAVYAATMSKNARGHRRRRSRQLAALGTVETSVARTRAELRPALEDAFRVYALRWQGRRDVSGFVTPTGKRFHRAALLRLAEQDVPRLVTIRLDGRAIAFALSLQLDSSAYGLTTAFDPEFARYSPGWEAILLRLETAAGEGISRFEFLGAAMPHKQRLTEHLDPIYQGIGLARTLRGRAAVEALVGGIRVRRAIKRSDTARKLYYRRRSPRLSRPAAAKLPGAQAREDQSDEWEDQHQPEATFRGRLVVEAAADRQRLPLDRAGDRPIEDMVPLPVRAPHRGRVDRAHPVDPVVVPLVGPFAGDPLPPRRCVLGGTGGHVDVAVPLLVEVPRRRVLVAEDVSAGREAKVGLAVVPVDDDVGPCLVPKTEPVVAVEDFDGQGPSRSG